MANNPFSESDLIARLRNKGISTADLDDDAMIGLLDDSLQEYLFYKPKVSITTGTTCITTANGQPSYDLPTGALWVIDVNWNPDYGSEFDDLYREMLLKQVNEDDTSIMLLDYRKMSLLHKYFKGHWKIMDGKIFLMPCPHGVFKVSVVYASSRTLSELDAIADRRFVDLFYYTCLMAVGTKKLTGGGWKAGAFAVDAKVGDQTIRAAEKGLERTRLLLANSAQVRRS